MYTGTDHADSHAYRQEMMHAFCKLPFARRCNVSIEQDAVLPAVARAGTSSIKLVASQIYW